MSTDQNQLPPHGVNVLLYGDCLERLADLPADSVQCCMTSPPLLWTGAAETEVSA